MCVCVDALVSRGDAGKETRFCCFPVIFLFKKKTTKTTTHSFPSYRFLPMFLISTPPITPAATARPLTMATPIRPSRATLSSISVRRFDACRFAGSFSRSRSLYRRASA